MKNQSRKFLAAIFGIALTVSVLASTARADQPFMHQAKDNLEDAVKYLKKASADKGGHRERAMELVSRAISAVNSGIDYDRTHLTPGRRGRRNYDFDENNLAAISASNFGDQPNMEKARSFLESALSNLNRASADKGGYREQAMSLVRDAISQVNEGIDYDRTH